MEKRIRRPLFPVDTPTVNGRVYTSEVVANTLAKCAPKIEQKLMLAFFGRDDGDESQLNTLAGTVEKLEVDKGVVYADLLLTEEPPVPVDALGATPRGEGSLARRSDGAYALMLQERDEEPS